MSSLNHGRSGGAPAPHALLSRSRVVRSVSRCFLRLMRTSVRVRGMPMVNRTSPRAGRERLDWSAGGLGAGGSQRGARARKHPTRIGGQARASCWPCCTTSARSRESSSRDDSEAFLRNAPRGSSEAFWIARRLHALAFGGWRETWHRWSRSHHSSVSLGLRLDSRNVGTGPRCLSNKEQAVCRSTRE